MDIDNYICSAPKIVYAHWCSLILGCPVHVYAHNSCRTWGQVKNNSSTLLYGFACLTATQSEKKEKKGEAVMKVVDWLVLFSLSAAYCCCRNGNNNMPLWTRKFMYICMHVCVPAMHGGRLNLSVGA
jgi:hypothetical protein